MSASQRQLVASDCQVLRYLQRDEFLVPEARKVHERMLLLGKWCQGPPWVEIMVYSPPSKHSQNAHVIVCVHRRGDRFLSLEARKLSERMPPTPNTGVRPLPRMTSLSGLPAAAVLRC